MNYRQLPASSLRNGRLTWVQLLVAGVVVVGTGGVAQSDPQGLSAVTVNAAPIAALPINPADSSKYLSGQGLCSAYRSTTLPGTFFKGRTDGYPTSVASGTEPFAPELNRFMDGELGSATNSGLINYQTMQTPFDLAAFASLGLNTDGDFLNTRGCEPSTAGCAFPASGPNNVKLPPFGSRYRGFFRVTNELAGQQIHFGFTTNSAVALRFWPKQPTSDGSTPPYEIIVRPSENGQADFRVSNSIIFKNPGLYAVEILHASANDAARLEMAITTLSFTDFDERSGVGTMPLGPNRGGFQLTTPEQFFQRLDGALAFPGKPADCQQCPRRFAGQPKGSAEVGCPSCMACNEAAVCQICNTASSCGCTCAPCEGSTPYCTGDPTDLNSLHCVECEKDEQCGSGQNCVENKCVGFCPCCESPKFCTATDTVNKPSAKNCSACRTSTDCPDGGYCDLINGRCLPKAPEHNSDRDCGLNAVNCVESTKNDRVPRKLCMNGEVCVQCRYDADCDRGNYCRSGDCIPCRDDRHCGASCGSCGMKYIVDAASGDVVSSTMTNTPVCYAPPAPNEQQPAPAPTCVECLSDAHCGNGGICDLASHTCSKRVECSASCPANQICSGGGCVECLTSSQCPCGQCAAGICTASCGDTSDCLSNQCCSQETATCISGRCKPGLTAHGGALCCDATAGGVGGATDPAAPVRSRTALWLMLAALVTLAALQLRALRLRTARRGRE